MAQAGENDQNIGAVVSAFTQKYGNEPAKPNLAQSIGQALVKPVVWAGTRIGQTIAEGLGVQAAGQDVATNIPGLGTISIKAPQSFKQEAGQALQLPALAMGPVSGAATYGLGEGLANNESASKVALRTGAYALGGKLTQYAGRLAEPLLEKAGTALGKVVPQAAKQGLGKLASAVEPAISKYNSAINDTKIMPGIATKGIAAIESQLKKITGLPDKLATKASQQLEQTNLRLTPVQKQKLGKELNTVTEYLSEKKIVGTPEARFEKVDGIYNKTEDTLQSFLKNEAKGRFVSKKAFVADMQGLKANYQSAGTDTLDIEKQIDRAINVIETRYPEKIPVDRFNEFKRTVFKNAYNKAGEKVLDEVEFDIGDLAKKYIQQATQGLKVAGVPIQDFNKEYGTLIKARKLLYIAQTRKQIGLIGHLIASAVGGGFGTHLGGPVGTGLGAAVGNSTAEMITGTAARSGLGAVLRTVGR